MPRDVPREMMVRIYDMHYTYIGGILPNRLKTLNRWLAVGADPWYTKGALSDGPTRDLYIGP